MQLVHGHKKGKKGVNYNVENRIAISTVTHYLICQLGVST